MPQYMSLSWDDIMQILDENEERIVNEQTDIARAEYRGGVGVTTRTVPSPTDLDVGQSYGTVGGDTLPVPERVEPDAMDVPVGEPCSGGVGTSEGSSGVSSIPDGGTYRMLPDGRIEYSWDTRPDFREWVERSNEMPNYTTQWYAPVTTAGSTTSPYILRYELGYPEPEPTPPTPRPEPRVNEIILSDDPVEQYYLTAISFFKGLKEPEGGSGGYGRTHTQLKESIIEAMETQLKLHKERTGRLPVNYEDDEVVRYRPARGRTR